MGAFVDVLEATPPADVIDEDDLETGVAILNIREQPL